jgi:curved DNA-binding protein CbpA
MPKRDPHVVLGIDRGAGMAAVKAAWRRLARAHHPDVSAGDAAAARAATTRMAEINAAYDALRQRDAERRAGLRPAARRHQEAGGAAPPEAPARRSGPPRPRPTRPVTGRVDTSATYRPRNATTRSASRADGTRLDGRRLDAAGPDGDRVSGTRLGAARLPPRARPVESEPPRASEPTGPLRRHRVRPRPILVEPSLREAQDFELRFGKFHGHTLGEIADFEPSYIDWLASTMTRDPDLVAAARVIRRRLDELGVRRRGWPSRRPARLG